MATLNHLALHMALAAKRLYPQQKEQKTEEKVEEQKMGKEIGKNIEIPILPLITELFPVQKKAVSQPKLDVDLGRINPLVLDSSIESIICDGPNIPVKLSKAGVVERSNIVLNAGEIDLIIKKFSEYSGERMKSILRAKYSNLEIFAVYMPDESKFIIHRIQT